MGSVKDTIQRRGGIASAAHDLLLTERKLVGFREFILSPDYMALEGVYPFWLKESDALSQDHNSLILTGSLGGGKSSFMNMVICYKLYYWFNQGDLYNYFQILRGTPIYFCTSLYR